MRRIHPFDGKTRAWSYFYGTEVGQVFFCSCRLNPRCFPCLSTHLHSSLCSAIRSCRKIYNLPAHAGSQWTGASGNIAQFFGNEAIDVADCQGQSYDNVCNMSGKYNGMQAIIRQQSKLADYVPCAPHSLNLVGQSAAGCCQVAWILRFHSTVILIFRCFNVSLETFKWYYTRRSACADATKALVKGYDEINDALEGIAADIEQKAGTRQEARGLASYMNRLETGIRTCSCVA